MPRRFFVDAWYFIASIDRSDAHYTQIRRLAAVVANGILLTHDAVLSEVLSFFSGHGEVLRREAASAVRRALVRLEVVSTSGHVFNAALNLYERRPDKEYSLVDCMSMVVMEERRIRHVLTNDHHFTQAGFVVVNE